MIDKQKDACLRNADGTRDAVCEMNVASAKSSADDNIPYRNIVFSGTGLGATANAGTLYAMYRHDTLVNEVMRVSATSGGTMAALVFTTFSHIHTHTHLDLIMREYMQVCLDVTMLLRSAMDMGTLPMLLKMAVFNGIVHTNTIRSVLQRFLKNVMQIMGVYRTQNNEKTVTLRQWYEMFGIHLYVNVFNLTRGEIVAMSSESPFMDMHLLDVGLAACAVPIVFQPVKLFHSVDDLFYDAAIASHYDINIFREVVNRFHDFDDSGTLLVHLGYAPGDDPVRLNGHTSVWLATIGTVLNNALQFARHPRVHADDEDATFTKLHIIDIEVPAMGISFATLTQTDESMLRYVLVGRYPLLAYDQCTMQLQILPKIQDIGSLHQINADIIKSCEEKNPHSRHQDDRHLRRDSDSLIVSDVL